MRKALLFWMLLCGFVVVEAQTGCGFLIENPGAVTVCNNIVINNGDSNVNVMVSATNITQNASGIFVDEENNFSLSYHSPAIDAGDSLCGEWAVDMSGVNRIVNATVDIGAFEFPVEARPPQYAVHQVGEGGLLLCNNIVVNNPQHAAMTNIATVSVYNILSDSVSVFSDAQLNFIPYSSSPAVNAGQNSCVSLAVDLRQKPRVSDNVVDIGAFEYVTVPVGSVQEYVVWQNQTGALTFCNNIDINNCAYALNTNIPSASGHNIVTDNDTLFTDNIEDYMPRPGSLAVDFGSNTCNTLAVDLYAHPRVMGAAIDAGAFEQHVVVVDTFGDTYAVHQVPQFQLVLCNNIIVNNLYHTDETNIVDVPDNNILSDSVPVFSDAALNFKLYDQSPAVDAGENSCNALPTDIDTVPRISGSAIDVGAFEVPVLPDTTTQGGGGGGGGGSGVYYPGGNATVFRPEGSNLVLCNNIIINNSVFVINVDLDLQTDTFPNIVEDTDTLFTDNHTDYMPLPASAAVNTGCNECNTVSVDLAKHTRIYEDIIDIGALEQFHEDTVFEILPYAVHQLNAEGLVLCNNIIVNNPYHIDVTNVSVVPNSNILSDSIPVFVDAVLNYSLWSNSPAVDAGENSCCSLIHDIRRGDRVVSDTIDIGAYEYKSPNTFSDTTFAVDQAGGQTLNLCNNIIINNGEYAVNTNIENVPWNNIVVDQDSLFIDNVYNYMPREESDAVNGGSNDCNRVDVDLSKNPRIMADTIDIGAYEQFVDKVDTFAAYAVHQVDSTCQLILYNNIIINNVGHAGNAHGNISGDHNLLEDTPNVFIDDAENFLLQQQSPAIDMGDNQWVSWPKDLKGDVRIACSHIVDQGAYEFSFSNMEASLTYSEVETDNCQGFYILLTATYGAQHYHWLHTNEDTNVVQVSPLIPTEYTVIASNGGECADTATVYVVPSSVMSDSLSTPASVGKTFWLSYLRNHFQTPTLTLNVSAEEACTGTVRNPRTGWSTSFSVGSHAVATVSIPVAQAYIPNADMVGDYGLLVQTTDTVSVYAANYNTSSFDVTDVLPVNALSDEYVLQTYTPMMNAEFVVVATEDSTMVDITPSRALQGGHGAQQTFTVTLQAGQTYLGLSQFGGVLGDLSGTVIHAHGNKPIAVFNGNVCALVPSDNSYTDHLVEQAVGVKYWGRSFAISSTQGQNFDVVRVTALRNNTEVKKNGVLLTTLQAYQTHEFQLSGTEGSCYLETSKPAGVYLYIAGALQGNPQEKSDPSMIWIPPTEQMMNDITFATFNSPGISDHYVNIVIPASSVNEVTFDGIPIGGQFSLLNSNPDFMFVRKHIANGTHTLHCNSGFIAHCYGLGYHESYGYAVGSKAVPLKEQLFVNGILSAELPADLKFCPYEPIQFSTYVNYPCDSVTWNFGDSTPIVNAPDAVHAYEEAGTYTVAATLYITSNETVFCSNLYAHVRVSEGPTILLHDTVCQGDTYQLHGFDILAEENGLITETRTVSAPGQYCDSTYVLELFVLNNHFLVNDTICVNNHYTLYGFDVTPMETGLYLDTIIAGHTSDGCDSMVILQLSVTPNTDNPPAIEGEPYPCQGGEYTYSIDSLSGLQNVVWTMPDSVMVLSQSDPYQISILLGTYADSMQICVSAEGGCGVLEWCRTVYPQPYNYVQLFDTICANETLYSGYGFMLTDVSDSNDLFVNHSVSAGGCDSTTVLRLVFLPVYEAYDTITICHNELPYMFHDTLLVDTGLHRIVLATVSGCDSAVNLVLRSNPLSQTAFDTTVCDVMVWNGMAYTESGSYDSTFTNVYGCDSVVTMHLTVYYSDTVAVDSAVCRSELPVTWNGFLFSDAGEMSATLSTAHGCDSLVVMTLTVNEATEDTLHLTLLENNLPYNLNGHAYTEEGTYLQQLENAAGCDSTLTIVLTVLNNVTNSADSAICGNAFPFTWNGVTFTHADTLVAVLVAANGVDSAVVMAVTEIPPTYGTTDTVIVENSLPFVYNGITYTAGGTYTQTLTNSIGCDSILTVNLTVLPNVTVAVDSTICENKLPFLWNAIWFTEAGVNSTTLLASTGVDSTVVMTVMLLPATYGSLDTAMIENDLPFMLNGANYYYGGVYYQTLLNSVGCDSVVTVTLTVYENHTVEVDSVVCVSNLPIVWNDSLFTGAGTKTTMMLASTGADSTVVMTVTVIDTAYGTVDLAVVENDLPFVYNDSVYTTEGIFTQYLTSDLACDSVLTVTLTVWPNVTAAVDSTVCEGSLPFTWNDSVFTAACTKTTTILAHTGADSTITMTVTVIPTTYGTLDTTVVENALPVTILDSVYGVAGTHVQNLTNAAGCDSILTVNVEVHYNVTEDIYDTVCQGQLPVIWNGVTFTAAGTQNTLLTAHTGADSTVVMHLTVIPTTYGTVDTAVIENLLPLVYNDSVYGTEGAYNQNLTNAAGCDSVLTVNVTVHYNVTSQVDSVVCEADLPFTWNDSVFTAAGTKTTTIPASTGADSTITMHLMVNFPSDSTLHVTVLENSLPFILNDSSYAGEGTYIQHLVNAVGCDSTLTVNLAVLYNVSAQADSTICASELPFTWNGVTFTQAGSQNATLTAANGVDSVVTMTLTVKPLSDSTLNVSVIQNNLPYTLNGDSYAAPGTYYQHLTNAVGCDSTLTINLTVYYNVTTQVDTTVCAADLPYTWHGHTFTAVGNHLDTLLTSHGADSTVTYHLSVDNIGANVGNATHVTCYGDSTGAATATVAGGQSPMTYAWTSAAGASVSATTSMSQVPAGAYTFTVTDHIGCSATATVTLSTLNGELVPGAIADNQEVCDGEDVAPFTGTAASGGDNGAYQWQISANGTDWATAPGTANAQDYTYPNLAASTFMLRRAWVSQSCGTVYSNTVTVNVWPNSSDTLTAEVCQGDVYQENGFDITEDQTAEAGEYTFEQHYSAGHCDSAVVLQLTVHPTYEVSLEDEVCEGDGYNENGFHVLPGETVGEGELERVLHLQSVHGCDSTVTLQLSVIDTALRIVSLTEDFCEEMSAELTVVTGLPDYVWNTGETAPTITVTAPGVYAVTASQEGGCSASAYLRIDPCQNALYLANSITPSRGDGLNDYFCIPERNQRDMVNFEIFIYNRWGEMVFYSTDKNFRWNGEYRGQIQYQTIYNYVIRYLDTSGHPRMVQGSVTVL